MLSLLCACLMCKYAAVEYDVSQQLHTHTCVFTQFD